MFIKIYLGYNNQEKNIYKIILLNERSKYLKKLNKLLNKNLNKFRKNENMVSQFEKTLIPIGITYQKHKINLKLNIY